MAGGRILIADIQRETAARFRVPLAELVGRSQKRRFTLPRQVAMYLARELTPHSLNRVGQFFDRDHTTVLDACRVVDERMRACGGFRGKVVSLRRKLEAEKIRAPSPVNVFHPPATQASTIGMSRVETFESAGARL